MINWIDIYTDGATSGNGTSKARGGWAYVFCTEGAQPVSEYGGEIGTTNNRMELMAAIKGIEVTVHTYVIVMSKNGIGIGSLMDGLIALKVQ